MRFFICLDEFLPSLTLSSSLPRKVVHVQQGSLFSGLHPLLFFFHEDVYYFSYLRGEPAMLMPREVDHCHVFRDGFLRDLCRPYYIIVALEMLSLEALFARMICLSWPNSLLYFWLKRVTPGAAFVNISSKIPLAYWIALVLSDDNPTS